MLCISDNRHHFDPKHLIDMIEESIEEQRFIREPPLFPPFHYTKPPWNASRNSNDEKKDDEKEDKHTSN